MSKPQHSTIEINGKRYDARTGQLISGHPAPKPAAKPTHTRPVADISRSVAPSKQIHSPMQRSKTLMRAGLKRPERTTTPVKAQTSKAVSDIARPVKLPKVHPSLHHQFDAAREARANKIKRSSLVRKFSDMTGAQSKPAVAEEAVVVPRVTPLAVRPAPKATEKPAPHKRTHAILEQGLRNASSHHETYRPNTHAKKKSSKRARLASIGAGGLAVLLLVAFIGYQNIPNISMRYAASRSGVQATLPGYKPAGFALNSHIQYNPGQITVQFSSNTDERSFSITQRDSNWNSDSLMSNYVSSASDRVQTYEDKGRTIYLYGDANATWVNGGIWYDIKGDSKLNSDQLIRIATSM